MATWPLFVFSVPKVVTENCAIEVCVAGTVIVTRETDAPHTTMAEVPPGNTQQPRTSPPAGPLETLNSGLSPGTPNKATGVFDFPSWLNSVYQLMACWRSCPGSLAV
jgi:hypothetical protein